MKERFCCGQPFKSNKRIQPSNISGPLHLILQAPSPASHEFEWKNVPGVKRFGLCQVCHLVQGKEGLRCKSCGLRVHPQCGSKYSSSKEADSNLKTKTGSSSGASSGGDKRDANFNQDRHKNKSHQHHQHHQDSLFYKQFEPRIKKILHTPLLPSIESGCEDRTHSGASSSARFSSCGDSSVACSTAIALGTVSVENSRSESKTPEITITPGSDVAVVEVGTEIERHLSSSASELPDSGFAGLLDEDEDSNSQRAESTLLGLRSPEENKADTTSQRLRQEEELLITHVDGPLDNSPYAVINPLKKHKTFSDFGFPFGVDQMKDLDRLISGLLQEAESIDSNPNSIPYHARQDSLPFSYTSPQSITSHQAEKRNQHHQQSQSYSTTVDSGRVLSPLYASPAAPSSTTARGRNTHGHEDYSSVEQQILQPQQPTGLSRSISISHQPSYSSNYGRSPQSAPAVQHQMHGSLSSNNMYGNGSSGGVRRNRSQSADGRRDYYERDEDPDQWLARQMKKLHDKKASKHVVKNDWLAELKRALPTAERSQSQSDYSHHPTIHEFRPSQISNELRNPHHHNISNDYRPLQISNDFRPSQTSHEFRSTQNSNEYRSSQTSRAEATPTTQTPVSAPTPARGNIAYSTDDDEDDVEMEMFQKGRKVQRHYSESAYDRGYNTSSSSRAPSQQSYTETPFPICPPTPYTNRPQSPPGKPPRSPKGIRRYQGASSAPIGTIDVLSSRMERAQTPVNPRPIYMVDSEVKFAQDLSEYWYKPFAAREETVSALMQSPPGSFVIRNSNSFPGAYGLAIKVSDFSGEKGIRHFLIEPTKFGVRLRGMSSGSGTSVALEPVFGSLSALVCAHTIEPLALPTTLTLPSYDILPSSQSQSTTAHLLKQGAACQLLFLGMAGVECLSGEEAISRGINEINVTSPVPISLRLSRTGLSITDVFRKQFFRIHFALNEMLYAAVVTGKSVAYGREVKQVFGVVARAPRATENSVILLAELEQGQPANAIVSFIQRVLAWQQH